MNLLKRNKHYNTYLQNAFNKYESYEFHVLFESNKISDEELSEIEIFYIDYMKSYDNGYNLTKGGEGGLGIVIDEKGREQRSKRTIGELNPQSKLSNEQFFEIVDLLKQGKSNQDIAEIYSLHDRYVSLIRHKKRFKKLWEEVEDYIPVNSDSQKRGLSYDEFEEIVDLLHNGYSNAEIERLYNLGSGTGSRIRHKKLYKSFWNKYYGD